MALQPRFWELRWIYRNLECGFAALSTSSTPAAKPEVEPLENEAVAPEFTNRNPGGIWSF
jgi:large subunit ribosomal protein L18